MTFWAGFWLGAIFGSFLVAGILLLCCVAAAHDRFDEEATRRLLDDLTGAH